MSKPLTPPMVVEEAAVVSETGPEGSVPRGKIGGVYPFAGAGVCLQEHLIPCFGLCGAGGRVRTSPEPSAIR